MKYIIERSSDWFPETAPIPGAVISDIHEYIRVKKGYENQGGFRKITNWEDDGNGIVRGYRPEPSSVWIAEIEDLHGLVLKTGHSIILKKPDNAEGLWRIEIYDSYRE